MPKAPKVKTLTTGERKDLASECAQFAAHLQTWNYDPTVHALIGDLYFTQQLLLGEQ